MSCREKGGASGKRVELGNCGIGDTKEAKEESPRGRKKESFKFRKRIATSDNKVR